MHHINGDKWTNETITNGIHQVMHTLCLERMPTHSEVKTARIEIGLDNAICRTLGYYGWAEKLNISVKNSDTLTGITAEKEAKLILEQKGYNAELTPIRFPYDLYVNKSVKIDVKMANIYKSSDGFSFYSFALNKIQPTCDLYMLIAKDKIGGKKIYIIPSIVVPQKQISIGEFTSKYDKYESCFCYIDKFIDFYKGIA